MIDMVNGLNADSMQLIRISEHPIQTEKDLIVVDNLESGELRIYDHSGGSLNIQQLFSGYGNVQNAVLVAKIIINDLWKDDGLFIHKIFCEYGYENLAEPMLNQVLHFAHFYDSYRAVGISDREYNNWHPHAGSVLADFQKINRVYQCWIN